MEKGGGPARSGPDNRALLGGGFAAGVRWALESLKLLLQVTILAAVLWMFVFQVSVVQGHSMDPSLEPGDKLVVDKLSRHFMAPGRFDIVVFSCPGSLDRDYVKRVVGLPGETMELRAGDLYVNGERVEQNFGFTNDYSGFGPVRVPEGCYFVLGDNRPRSHDSRGFAENDGAVPARLIKGVVRFRIYPFGRMKAL